MSAVFRPHRAEFTKGPHSYGGASFRCKILEKPSTESVAFDLYSFYHSFENGNRCMRIDCVLVS